MSPPADAKRPPPGPGTATSKPPSAPPPCRQPGSATPTWCAKYRRIAARRGKLRAIVAVERAILTAIWHMLSTGTYYQDPGPDYYSRHDPSKGAARAVHTLRALGYQVTVHPAAVAN